MNHRNDHIAEKTGDGGDHLVTLTPSLAIPFISHQLLGLD